MGLKIAGKPPPGGRNMRPGEAAVAGMVRSGVGVMLRGWPPTPAELPNIKNSAAYRKQLQTLPDWRIGCIFTGSRHRGTGVARAAVAGTLEAIRANGGGVVEAYPEQVEGRPPQRGAYLHTGPETLFEEFGFVRDRRIAKWRWVMRLDLTA